MGKKIIKTISILSLFLLVFTVAAVADDFPGSGPGDFPGSGPGDFPGSGPGDFPGGSLPYDDGFSWTPDLPDTIIPGDDGYYPDTSCASPFRPYRAVLRINEIKCFDNVVVGGEQACTVDVRQLNTINDDIAAAPVSVGATVTVYPYNDFTTCTTDITGKCNVRRNETETGTATIYASATKYQNMCDVTAIKTATYTIFKERYGIQHLKLFSDDNFTAESYEYFRNNNVYASFEVVDMAENNATVTDPAIVDKVALISPPGGRADLTDVGMAGSTFRYKLTPIPPTHEFKGESEIFAIAINFTDESGGQLSVPLTILNNPPKIQPKVNDITMGSLPVTVDLSAHEFDIEDKGADLRWSVAESSPVFDASVSGKTLTVTPRALGSGELTLTLKDIDGWQLNDPSGAATQKVNVVIRTDILGFVDVRGFVDGSTNKKVFGWAYDPGHPKEATQAKIRLLDPNTDSVKYTFTADANIEAIDLFENKGVPTADDINHRFDFTYPLNTIADGTYRVNVKGVDLDVGENDLLGENNKLVTFAKPVLQIKDFACRRYVVEGKTQKCQGRVLDDAGKPLENADVAIKYADGSVFFQGKTAATGMFSSNEIVTPIKGVKADYTVTATATKTNFAGASASYLFTTYRERYDIVALKAYNSALQQESTFTRGDNMYVSFRISDRLDNNKVLPFDNDLLKTVTLNSYVTSLHYGGGGAVELTNARDDAKVASLVDSQTYVYKLTPIPLNHDFIGDSNVLAFVLNFTDETAGQQLLPVTIRNNPPVITFTGPINVGLDSSAEVTLTGTDAENDQLKWSVTNNNPGLFTASVAGNKLTVTGSKAGSGSVVVSAKDLDFDIDNNKAEKTITVNVNAQGTLAVTGISCKPKVVIGNPQLCNVEVKDTAGNIVGDADVSIKYNSGSTFGSCATSAFTGGCGAESVQNTAGTFTVYATASKSGFIADTDNTPTYTYEVIEKKFDVEGLASYKDAGFTDPEDTFFRGNDLFVAFKLKDLELDSYISQNQPNLQADVSLNSPDTGKSIALAQTSGPDADSHYYMAAIPITHDFIGSSRVFTIVVDVKDNKGGQDQITVTILNNKPQITPPIGSQSTRVGSAIVIGLGSHEYDVEDSGASLRWEVYEQSTVLDATIEGKTLTITPQFTLGESQLTVRLYDLDNDFDEETFTVSIGRQLFAPAVDLLSPKADDVLENAATVTWSASDADQAAETLDVKLEYKYNGTEWFVLEDGQNNNDGVFEWDVSLLPNANDYQFRITVTDDDGLTAMDSAGFFSVANKFSPFVTITNPTEGQEIRGKINITWTATDNDQDDATLDMLIEYRKGETGQWIAIESGAGNNDGTAEWDASSLASGKDYQLRVTATDSTGRQGVAFIRQLTVFTTEVPAPEEEIAAGPKEVIYIGGIDVLSIGRDSAEVLISIENVGDKKLEDLSVTVFIPEFAARQKIGPFDLKRGEQVSKRLILDIPSYAEGTYDARVSVSNDDYRRSKHREFVI